MKNKEAISHHAKGGQFSMQVVALAGRESFGGVEFALRVESRFALAGRAGWSRARWLRFALVGIPKSFSRHAGKILDNVIGGTYNLLTT